MTGVCPIRPKTRVASGRTSAIWAAGPMGHEVRPWTASCRRVPPSRLLLTAQGAKRRVQSCATPSPTSSQAQPPSLRRPARPRLSTCRRGEMRLTLFGNSTGVLLIAIPERQLIRPSGRSDGVTSSMFQPHEGSPRRRTPPRLPRHPDTPCSVPSFRLPAQSARFAS